jgi:DNA-directed RNA polymerase beta' subunit
MQFVNYIYYNNSNHRAKEAIVKIALQLLYQKQNDQRRMARSLKVCKTVNVHQLEDLISRSTIEHERHKTRKHFTAAAHFEARHRSFYISAMEIFHGAE